MIDDPVVHMGHVRAARLCARGARRWCEAHGLDHARLRDGTMRASDLEGTGDHFGVMVAAVARREAEAQSAHMNEGDADGRQE